MSKKIKIVLLILIAILVFVVTLAGLCRYFLNQGLERMETDPGAAKHSFERAIALNPFSGEPYAQKARAMYNRDSLTDMYDGEVDIPEEVLELYKNAIKRGFEERWVYQDLGDIFYKKSIHWGSFEWDREKGRDYANKAIHYFKKANEIEERAYEYYKKGYVHLEGSHEFEEALKYFEKAIEADPDYAYAYAGAGHTLNYLGDYEKASYYLDKSLEIEPVPFAYIGKAHTNYQLTNDPRTAIRQYLNILEIDPDNLGALYNLALMYQRMGNEDGYKYYLRRLKEEDEKNVFHRRIKELEEAQLN